MLDPQADPERRKMVLTSQIIVAALVAGCLLFLLVVLLIVPGKLGSWDLGLGKPMTCVGLVVVASGLPRIPRLGLAKAPFRN
jgi:hypothetical protein